MAREVACERFADGLGHLLAEIVGKEIAYIHHRGEVFLRYHEVCSGGAAEKISVNLVERYSGVKVDAGGTSVFAAINTYEISFSLLKPKETSAY